LSPRFASHCRSSLWAQLRKSHSPARESLSCVVGVGEKSPSLSFIANLSQWVPWSFAESVTIFCIQKKIGRGRFCCTPAGIATTRKLRTTIVCTGMRSSTAPTSGRRCCRTLHPILHCRVPRLCDVQIVNMEKLSFSRQLHAERKGWHCFSCVAIQIVAIGGVIDAENRTLVSVGSLLTMVCFLSSLSVYKPMLQQDVHIYLSEP